MIPAKSESARQLIVAVSLVSSVVFGWDHLAANVENSEVESIVRPGVWGLDFSSDGKWLAAATNLRGKGGPIVVWKISDWSQHIVRHEEDGGLHVSFSPNSRLLAYSTRGKEVTLIDVESKRVEHKIEAHATSVFCVIFTPRGKTLVTSSSDKKIKFWDVASGELKRTIDGKNTIHGVAVSPDGTKLLSGDDRLARLWDLETEKETQRFGPRGSIVRRVTFSNDGRYFLVSSWDGRSRVHETIDGNLILNVRSGSDCSHLTADNRFLATVGWNNEAHVFRVDLRSPSKQQTQQVRDLIRRFKSNDYKVREAASAEILKLGLCAEPFLRKAINSSDAEVRVRARRLRQKVRSPDPTWTLPDHAGDVEVVRFSADGRLLASACRGGDIKLWTVPEFKEIRVLHAPVHPSAN